MMGVAFLFSQNLKLKLKKHVCVGQAEILEDAEGFHSISGFIPHSSPCLVHKPEGPRLAPLEDDLWAPHPPGLCISGPESGTSAGRGRAAVCQEHALQLTPFLNTVSVMGWCLPLKA